MANQNFRVKKGLEVGLGATFLYADDTGVGINSAVPRSNLDVRGNAIIEAATIGVGVGTTALEVLGLSTFRDDVYVEGNLFLTGDIGFDDFTANTGNILGVLTTADFRSTGIATMNDVIVEGNLTVDNGGGGGTEITDNSIETEFLNVTGFTTTVGLNVTGESNFIGTVTTQDDLKVGGTISAGVGSFVFTELSGQDLFFTGIATFQGALNSNQLQVGVATVNDLYIDNLLYDSDGNVGAADSILLTKGGKLVWGTKDDAGIATSFQPGSTFYVAENGLDSNDGLSHDKAWASLSYALSQVTAGTNDIIEVGAGDYTETFPLTVPDGVTIRGTSQRSTFIRPTVATETNNGFELGDASTVEKLTIGGMYKPTPGDAYAFVFRSGAAITTRSPYVSQVTVLNKGSQITADDPYGFNTPDNYGIGQKRAAGGVLADGAEVDPSSIEAGYLLNEVTIFSPANDGFTMTNGARVELINCFTYFAERGIYGVSDLTTGFAGNGRTRLALDNASATPVVGNTIEYYDTDGTTVLASGTINEVSGGYVYLDDAGIGTFAVPRNRVSKAINFIDGAQISTAQAKFGSSSLDVTGSGSDAITLDATRDFGFGTGDFSVETFVYLTSLNNNKAIFDFRDSSATDSALTILESTSGTVVVTIAGAVVITSSGSLALNAWSHVAVSREAGTLYLFIDGVLEGSVANSTDLGNVAPLHIGDDYNDSNGVPGYFDEFRIQKGVARYDSAFTPPTSALTADKNTTLLLHFEGADGDTSTADDVITTQDIRFTGGNTADRTSLADYSQFGADLRSMGCAVEYGSQGIVGDGSGVLLRLISINFNHVGSGGDISNDYRDANKSLEVVKLNNAKIAYVSIDELGDFRVGDAFYVNQETGEVSFSNTVNDLTSLSSLTITDGVNASIITPSSGKFGNLLISGNTLESITGDVNIAAAGAGEVNIFGNTNISGILTAASVNLQAIQNGDTAVTLDDTGSDGTIRLVTDGAEALRVNNEQKVGIGTEAPRSDLDVIGQTQLENLLVTGISTIAGFFDGGTGGGDSTVTVDNIYVSGLTSTNNLQVDSQATVGFITANQLYANIGTVGIFTATTAFIEDLTITGDLTGSGGDAIIIDGDSVISGVVTIGTNSITLDGRAGQEYIEVGTGTSNRIVGFNTFTGAPSYVEVDEGIFRNKIDVAGVNSTSTFAGSVGIGSTLTADRIEFDSGAGRILNLTELNVDILNSGGGGGGVGGDQLNVTGISTLNLLIVNGISTFNSLANFTDINVSGFSTFVGFATFTDAYVGSALTVKNLTIETINTTGGGSLVVDTLETTNLSVSGIATIGYSSITDAEIGIATVSSATVGFATFTDAYVGSALTVKDLTIETINTTGGGSLVVDALETVDLSVTGVSTFVGLATFGSINVAAGGTFDTLRVTGNTQLNTANAAYINAFNIRSIGVATLRNINSDGIGTFSTLVAADITAGLSTFSALDVTTNIGVGGTVGATTFYGTFVGSLGGGDVDGLPPASIVSDTPPTTRDSGEDLESGDLWFDSDGLRQYTYYLDGTPNTSGLPGQWVDSNPQVTIPDLGVITDTAGLVINLVDDDLSLRGTPGQIETVGIGSTVTFRLTDRVAIAQDLTLGRDLSVGRDAEITGITTTNELYVTGISSFTGKATFNDDLEIRGDLILAGDISLDELSGANLNITGFGTIAQLEVTNDLYVGGISTFIGDSEFDSTLSLTSDSAILNLGFDDDLQISVGSNDSRISHNNLAGNLFVESVTSTFIKIADTSGAIVFQKLDNENIARFLGDSGVELYYNGTKTFDLIETGLDLVGDITFTGNLNSPTGIATVGFVSTTDVEFRNAVGVGLTLSTLVVTENITANGVGVVTTNSDAQLNSLAVTNDVDIDGNLSVEGNISDVDTIGGLTANFADGSFGGSLFGSELSFVNAVGTGISLAVGVAVSAILDEDTLASDRADALATQQSIKKYVDDAVSSGTGAVDIKVAGNVGVATVNLDSEILTIDGINNIESIAIDGVIPKVTFDLTDDVTIVNDLTVQNDLFVDGDTNLVTATLTGDLGGTTATFSGLVIAEDYNSTSDRRVKENIRPIEGALDKVSELNGVHFDFINSGKKSMGVIAQDVEKVFPELIAGTFPKSVNYNGLIGALIESVKELKEQNEIMRAEIEELKKSK